MKRMIWIAIIFLSPMFCASALGCVCIHLPDQTPEDIKLERIRAFDRAAAVFTGEVVNVDKGKATFKVDRIWKGNPQDEIVITMFIVNDDGTGSFSSCDKQFALGEKHLIFAYNDEGVLKAHDCTPTTRYEKLKDVQELIETLNELAKPEVRNKEPK